MKRHFFRPNLEGRGRWVRAFGASALLVGGLLLLSWHGGLGLLLMAGGVFVAYEAARGWCLLRACGIRTRL